MREGQTGQMEMRIYEAQQSDELLDDLITMSADWEAENSCYGYRKNDRSDIAGNRIFLAEQGGEVLGYLFGRAEKSERPSSVIAEETSYFEIEELYVVPEHRSEGIGRALFRFVEREVQAMGIEYIMLSTATKNYKSILHFYIDELGMEFWSARLFKRI